MPDISSILGTVQPQPTAINYANQLADQQARQNLMAAQQAGIQSQIQGQQLEQANQRRQMALSMLNGINNEPDPNKQAALYKTIAPMVTRYDPSIQLPDEWDSSLGRALTASLRPPENLVPASFLSSPAAQGLNPLIRAGLQSGQLSLKDVLAAQSQNPFLNIATMPAMSNGGGSSTAAGSEVASQPDYVRNLSQLPSSMQPTVKAIIEGREMPPTPNSRAPGAAALEQAVNMVDPSFDFVNAAKRQSTSKSFASGQDAASVTSLNTLAGHLDQLQKAWNGLDNEEGSGLNPFRVQMNRLENETASGAGATALKTFGTAKSAVSDELSKLLKGGVVSDTEKKEWESALDQGATPDQQKAVLSEMTGIIESRLNALNNKYHEGMGPVDVQKDWATPQSRAVFDRLQGRPTNATEQAQGMLQQPGGAVAQANAALKPTTQQGNAAPEGTIIHDGKGNTMVKRNGQWVPQ